MTETNTTTAKGIMPKLSIMMFLQFWIWGAWYISIPKFVGTLGPHMSESLHYCYQAIPIAAMIAPFFLGLIADRFFNTEKLLSVLFLLSGVTLLLLPYIANMPGQEIIASAADGSQTTQLQVEFLGMTFQKYQIFNHIILAHSLCFMPSLALTASLSFQHLKNSSKDFPLVRLWGTFGWIFGALALILFNTEVAGVTTVAGEYKAVQFYLGGGAAILLAIFSLFLPKTPAPKKGQKLDIGALFFVDVWKEFKNKSFFVFVLCSFLLCIPLQAYYAYLQEQMTTQGFVNYASWKNAGTWLEALMMFGMPFLFRRLGVKKMISIGIFAWVVRYALFPLAANYGAMDVTPSSFMGVEMMHPGFLLIMAGVLLHGICYDFFFVTGQIYVDQVTDSKIRGQAQSMIIFFTQGLGMYIGAKFINGPLFIKAFKAKDIGEAYGNAGSVDKLTMWGDFWWPLCITAAVILVIFLIGFRHEDKHDAEFKH